MFSKHNLPQQGVPELSYELATAKSLLNLILRFENVYYHYSVQIAGRLSERSNTHITSGFPHPELCRKVFQLKHAPNVVPEISFGMIFLKNHMKRNELYLKEEI